jgi:indolepyruvate decarboxylase
MGYAVPAALGVQLAKPNLRPIVLVGDGAFQMTGTELSTIARLKLNPIIIVLNNHGYTTERFILDGPFNDIAEWSYDKITSLVGGGWSCCVRTQGELETALEKALANRKEFSLLNIHLDKFDHSAALERLGERFAKKIKRSTPKAKKPLKKAIPR